MTKITNYNSAGKPVCNFGKSAPAWCEPRDNLAAINFFFFLWNLLSLSSSGINNHPMSTLTVICVYCEHVCSCVSLYSVLFATFCIYSGDQLRWAICFSGSPYNCALHCFVDIHFMLLHSWLNKLIDWIDWLLLFGVEDCRRAYRDRGKAEQVKVTSLTGYGRSLPAAYCGVAASHGANESFDGDMVRTPITVLPPYSDDDRLTHESGSALVVGDAMSLQLLPNASSSSSASSTSSSTWRPPTSTTELWSSTQQGAATTARRDGRVPPSAWQGRPLPPPPPAPVDADKGFELGDELSAAPRLHRDRLRHIDSLGAGHFGEVFRLKCLRLHL